MSSLVEISREKTKTAKKLYYWQSNNVFLAYYIAYVYKYSLLNIYFDLVQDKNWKCTGSRA